MEAVMGADPSTRNGYLPVIIIHHHSTQGKSLKIFNVRLPVCIVRSVVRGVRNNPKALILRAETPTYFHPLSSATFMKCRSVEPVPGRMSGRLVHPGPAAVQISCCPASVPGHFCVSSPQKCLSLA